MTPLGPDRYQITFTASAETRDKLQFAQDLMRHTIPSGDTAAIMDEALTALLEKLARRKFAATERPGASRGISRERRLRDIDIAFERQLVPDLVESSVLNASCEQTQGLRAAKDPPLLV